MAEPEGALLLLLLLPTGGVRADCTAMQKSMKSAAISSLLPGCSGTKGNSPGPCDPWLGDPEARSCDPEAWPFDSDS